MGSLAAGRLALVRKPQPHSTSSVGQRLPVLHESVSWSRSHNAKREAHARYLRPKCEIRQRRTLSSTTEAAELGYRD